MIAFIFQNQQTEGNNSARPTRGTITKTRIAYDNSTWHARKYKVRKLHRRYILRSLFYFPGSIFVHFSWLCYFSNPTRICICSKWSFETYPRNHYLCGVGHVISYVTSVECIAENNTTTRRLARAHRNEANVFQLCVCCVFEKALCATGLAFFKSLKQQFKIRPKIKQCPAFHETHFCSSTRGGLF